MLIGFNPVIDFNSKRIVIGSMPSIASLNARQYYDFPYNAFWKIISVLFNSSNPFDNYSDKINCLLNNRIALWDSLMKCNRVGSLDSNITNEIPNDFNALFDEYKNIDFLIFNGQQAFKFFKKYNPVLLKRFPFAIMPSTSPANASVDFFAKLDAWKKVLLF